MLSLRDSRTPAPEERHNAAHGVIRGSADLRPTPRKGLLIAPRKKGTQRAVSPSPYVLKFWL